MRSKLRRLFAGLAMTAAVLSPAVALASPAQAAPPPAITTKCSQWAQAGPTGLWAATCASRDGIKVSGWTVVLNNSNAQQYYLSEIDVKMHFELNYNVCTINAWIPAGQQKTCSTASYVTNAPANTIGHVNYWTGSQYAWLNNVNSPSV